MQGTSKVAICLLGVHALQNEVVSNHDELMCNFFAQADALANGKSDMELRSEQVPEYLVPHKTFTGNRPSLSILLPDCTAYTVGQLLALYELRIGVQVNGLISMAPELIFDLVLQGADPEVWCCLVRQLQAGRRQPNPKILLKCSP